MYQQRKTITKKCASSLCLIFWHLQQPETNQAQTLSKSVTADWFQNENQKNVRFCTFWLASSSTVKTKCVLVYTTFGTLSFGVPRSFYCSWKRSLKIEGLIDAFITTEWVHFLPGIEALQWQIDLRYEYQTLHVVTWFLELKSWQVACHQIV